MSELSPSTKKLINQYQSWFQSLQPKEEIATIHVDEVTSKVAAFYEKMRGVVDWREEHLIRRAAIERILKRRLLIFKNGKDIAEPLVLELIRAGHFPNDKIPESKIEKVQKAINKYVFIIENSPIPPKEKQEDQLYGWILGIAACEVEEILYPPLRENALIDYMIESMIEKIKVNEGVIKIGGMTEEEKNNQIYIAVQRALLKLEPSLIIYNILKKRYHQWQDFTEINPQLQEIAKNIYFIWRNVEKNLRHPLSEKFYKICRRYNTPYLLLGDIISEDPAGIKEKIEDPEFLETKIKEVYQKRLKKLKERIKRAAIYATLSIFLSKILLAVLVELPIDKLTGQIASDAQMYVILGINILFPPLLMFFLILTIKPTKEDNLQQVVLEVIKITYATERKEAYMIEIPKKRSWLMNIIVTIFYFLTFVLTFGLIIWVLEKLRFGVLSMLIFLFFISLISFAGVKIRERARELEVLKTKESFFIVLIDFFSLPILRVGKWLSSQWVKYNIIVVFINFLIEMPLQIFVEFLEQWRGFLKEKKEEIH